MDDTGTQIEIFYLRLKFHPHFTSYQRGPYHTEDKYFWVIIY